MGFTHGLLRPLLCVHIQPPLVPTETKVLRPEISTTQSLKISQLENKAGFQTHTHSSYTHSHPADKGSLSRLESGQEAPGEQLIQQFYFRAAAMLQLQLGGQRPERTTEPLEEHDTHCCYCCKLTLVGSVAVIGYLFQMQRCSQCYDYSGISGCMSGMFVDCMYCCCIFMQHVFYIIKGVLH